MQINTPLTTFKEMTVAQQKSGFWNPCVITQDGQVLVGAPQWTREEALEALPEFAESIALRLAGQHTSVSVTSIGIDSYVPVNRIAA